MKIGEALNDLVTQIKTAGIAAVDDPRDLQLPGAWVTPSTISYDYLDGDTFSMAFDVYLIVGDAGTVAALNGLGGMLAQLRTVIPAGEATPVTIQLPNLSADNLPALQITIESQVTKDEP